MPGKGAWVRGIGGGISRDVRRRVSRSGSICRHIGGRGCAGGSGRAGVETLDQRSVVVIADRPHVVGTRRYAEEIVAGARAGAVDYAPLRTVPVFHKRSEIRIGVI